jgi:hypothetical protein
MNRSEFKNCTCLLALLPPLAMPLLAQAATIRVPADRPTIQAAIDAAVNGDEVVVAPGRYEQAAPISFGGKLITVRSEQGPAVTEIVSTGTDTGPVFKFDSNEGPASQLRGFRISGAAALKSATIAIQSSSPTIVGNEFVDNASSSTITVQFSSARLERNLFLSNDCGASPADANITTQDGYGPRFANNVFYDNETCVAFVAATASNRPTIVNNTILNNLGGVRMNSPHPSDSREALIRNNIIAHSTGAAGTFGFELDAYSDFVWENNLLFGMERPYINISNQTGARGNLMADPLLSGAEALDFRPDSSASPVIDAGLNSEVAAGEVDFHGEARINPSTNLVDIGAAEFYVDAPTVSLTLSPTSILAGESAELVWMSNGADSCVASGTWSGTQSAQGSLTINPTAPGDHDYTLTCMNDGVRRSGTVTLHVEPVPVIDFDASPSRTTLVVGDPLILQWTASYATSCEASGDWSGTKALQANETLQPSLGARTFTLTCNGPNGTATESINLTVVPAPTVSISVASGAMLTTDSTTLRWSSTNVTACTATGSWSGSIGTSGERTLSGMAAGTHSFQIECTSPADYKRVQAAATLTVYQAQRRDGGGGALGPLWVLMMLALAASRYQLLRRTRS